MPELRRPDSVPELIPGNDDTGGSGPTAAAQQMPGAAHLLDNPLRFASELLIALAPHFASVRCDMEQCPDLREAPFRRAIPALGQLIYIVPDSICPAEAEKQIAGGQVLATTNGFHIVSDGRPPQQLLCLHLAQPNRPGTDWRAPVRNFLCAQLGENWAMALAHKEDGTIGLLLNEPSPNGMVNGGGGDDEQNGHEGNANGVASPPLVGPDGEMTVWMAPVNRRIVAGCTKKVKKKVVRKVLRKNVGADKGETANGTIANGHTGEETKAQVHSTAPNDLQNGGGYTSIPVSTESCAVVNGTKVAEKASPPPTPPKPTMVNGAAGEKEEEENEKATSPALSSTSGYASSASVHPPSNINGSATNARAPFPPVSPPSPSESDNSSFSFQSAISTGGDSGVAARRAFRREDAPSPSSLHLAAVPQRRATAPNANGSANGGAGLVRLDRVVNGGAQLNILSPISSCGSVPERELEEELRSTRDDTQHTTQTTGAEDEETLMLLRGSVERSVNDGDDEELLSEMRDDFSLLSTTSGAAAAQRFPSPSSRQLGLSSSASMLTNGIAAAATRRSFGADPALSATSSSSSTALTLAMLNARGSLTRARIARACGESPSPPPLPTQHHHNNINANNGRSNGVELNNNNETTARKRSLSAAPQTVRGMGSLPVPALLQTLGMFSYREMGELRRVHPHWDELCGQLLNQAYSQLVGRAQRLLSDCQRRVHREPRMAQPIQLLTRLHVHVLNQVDSMRAFMDEGILCFPYGALLDRSFAMLAHIDAMIGRQSEPTDQEQREREYDENSAQMDALQELARRAIVHYRQHVEPEAEKRMGELYKFSAQQRLQRLDSFLVETSMTRVERESEKAREDMRWEMEQLKGQNAQLKKENRDLKNLTMKLDARVEVLERKFKTMARLLQ